MTKISSGLRTLFLINFVFAFLFGLLYLLIPATFMSWVGVSITDDLPYRLLGTAFVAFGVSSWLCYQAAEWEKVKIIVQAEIVLKVLGTLVCLYSLLLAGAPAALWINAIIFAGFAAAFVYFYTRK